MGRVDHAMRNVVFEQSNADGVEGLVDGGHLSEDIDAVLVILDHFGNAADLALCAFEASEIGLLFFGVAVTMFFFHTLNLYPRGVCVKGEFMNSRATADAHYRSVTPCCASPVMVEFNP